MIGQRVRLRPNAPLYAGREAKIEELLPDGKWRLSFTEFQLLGKEHVCDPEHASLVAKKPPTILAEEVRAGDLIGIGPGLALRVDHIVFDGPDGLLAGRVETDEPKVDTRHGALRDGQPYAAVVAAGSELKMLEGYRPKPVVIW